MKQAVVFIHGIGEQKPMETLRRFTAAVLPPAQPGKDQYWSKPDRMSELFELRRLQAPGRNQTHFYEYYWAYHVKGTTLRHLASWFFDIMKRGKKDIPLTLIGVWISIWVTVVLLIIIAFSGGLAFFKGWYDTQPSFGFATVGLMIIISLIQGFLIYYLGDAARYLDSHPKNITIRQKIRSEGLKLLRQLHNSRDYERIIVVGHSLGSVIGYDIISRLWIDYNSHYTFTENETELEKCLSEGKTPQPSIRHEIYNIGKKLDPNTNEQLDDFRNEQVKGWNEQRKWGNKWRISDFITLGSPLTHAMLLQAKSSKEFDERKRQRELPTCPPIKDLTGYTYTNKSAIKLANNKLFSPLILHHAAPFAITRWTNLYFPAFFGVFGDLVGGPLRKVYGAGIKDIPVKINSYKRFSLCAHKSYWLKDETESEKSINDNKGYEDALTALKKTIALDEGRKFK